MASIHHSHRHLPGRRDHADHLALLRALAGGLMAIVLLVALLASIAGGAVYALVLLLTMLFK